MICKVCGSEFNAENFDMCPYCMTPVERGTDSSREEHETVVPVEKQEDADDIHDAGINSVATSSFDDDYEITEEDLIEESDACEDEIPIDEIGLSVRAINAFRRAGIFTLNELMSFLMSNSVSDLKSVGAKTVQETEKLLRRIQEAGVDTVMVKPELIVERPIFENLNPDFDYLSIEALAELGLSHHATVLLEKNGIKCCGSLKFTSNGKLYEILGKRYREQLVETAKLLENSLVWIVNYVLDNCRSDRNYAIFLRRAKGETLQEIGDNPGEEDEALTRQRVRQIEYKFASGIMPFVREILYSIKGKNCFVAVQDLLDVFDDDEYDQVLIHACKGFVEFEYLDFAELFVERLDTGLIEDKAKDIILEIVGDGTDIYECREEIESALIENKIDYLSIDSVINLLKKNNYHMYGGFAVKGKANYSTVSLYVIDKFFPDGIKLSQSETEHTEDLEKLRKIIAEKYPGVNVPDSDRALSSTLVRNGLVLKGRGKYVSQEHVYIDDSLIEEIKAYIDAKETNQVFYNEIFAEFEGALRTLCDVDNSNYLHGVLALRFPDEYEYGKDYLLKNGISLEQAESIADRINSFIIKKGRPVSRTELFQEFRGFTYVMLSMPFTYDARLVQWDYKMYSSFELMNISERDVYELRQKIVELCHDNNGYTCDAMLYDKVLEERPDFIEKNRIESETNLFYIAAKLFSEEMDFRRPHICIKGMLDISSAKSVILYLMANPDTFTYEQFMNLSKKLKWSHVTASATLYDIEEDYARLSVSEYRKRSSFDVPYEVIDELHAKIEETMEDDILPIMSIDFDELPEWNYNWNEFVAESIIEEKLSDYLVVHPVMRDRRYQRGIVVKKETGLASYAQIVARKIATNGYHTLTESQLLSFLIVNNLAFKVIPTELSNSDYVRKEGDIYHVIAM